MAAVPWTRFGWPCRRPTSCSPPACSPSEDLAQSIMAFCRERVAPYKRFCASSSHLPDHLREDRLVELRAQDTDRPSPRGTTEFWEEDFTC